MVLRTRRLYFLAVAKRLCLLVLRKRRLYFLAVTNPDIDTLAIGTGIASVAADTSPQLGGNLDVNGNDIVSTSNADIDIIPNGTGDVVLAADTVKVGDSGAAAVLTSNGAGTLTVTTGGATDLVLSTNSGTDSGTITITDGANGNINFAHNGTGQVQAGGAQLSTVGKSIAMALVFG